MLDVGWKLSNYLHCYCTELPFYLTSMLSLLSGGDIASRHVGDLGNIIADDNGLAEGTLSDKLVKL